MICVNNNPVISPCWKKYIKLHILIVESDRKLMSAVKKPNPMKLLSPSYVWEFATCLYSPERQKNKNGEKTKNPWVTQRTTYG